jgi:hypothetical protein
MAGMALALVPITPVVLVLACVVARVVVVLVLALELVLLPALELELELQLELLLRPKRNQPAAWARAFTRTGRCTAECGRAASRMGPALTHGPTGPFTTAGGSAAGDTGMEWCATPQGPC